MKKISIVLGLGFGDEGKGLVTDYLASKSILRNAGSRPVQITGAKPLVVRFSGGHQAGHTVMVDGKKHIFSHFGSGTLRGVPTLWEDVCTVYPVRFMNEFNILQDLDINPKIYMGALCPVTTPFDVLANQYNLSTHGTVGVGFGTTLERESNHQHLFFQDLFHPKILEIKLKAIFEYYREALQLIHQAKGNNYDYEEILEIYNWREAIVDMTNMDNIEVVGNSYGIISKHNHIIFEASQGMLLDQKYGFFPHVTRSNTTSDPILDMIIEYELDDAPIDVYYITRAYQTRHGNGPMTNENLMEIVVQNAEEETNITNQFQGKLRKTVLDLDLINYALDIDNLYAGFNVRKNLVITCIDQLENISYSYKDSVYFVVGNNYNSILEKLNVKFSKVLLSSSPDSKNIKLYEKG